MKIKYETRSCSRCGGSGKYSFCTAYGNVCFKCSGKGKTLTTKGEKAQIAVNKIYAEYFACDLSDLKVGDIVRLSLSDGCCKIQEPVGAPVKGGSYTKNGVIVDMIQCRIVTAKMIYNGEVNTPVQRWKPSTEDLLNQIRSIKGLETFEEVNV